MKHRDIVIGFVRLHVLYHANKGPVCGSGLTEELGEHGYDISPGTLYPLLQRMEDKGYLASTWEQSGKESRRWYKITALGRDALREASSKLRELVGEFREGR